ncbi:heme/hemin ABC transporter substrate-binding protein [Labedella phragmitis]|uniref:heme/hemin ABC transporter substrate-binding protein n=1 Tax=Labedella phragmitis TaxID=2498849 RepID=UPI001FB76878|nr:ABC transporter substrate-binding protein [Labedella phragmitis]
MTALRRSPFLPVIASLVLLLAGPVLAGCTSATSGDDTAGVATPRLADVTAVNEPRSWEGPSTAVAPSSPVDPITEGEQSLPVTVTDRQGTTVEIDDTSRILALDIYGSLSRTVFELGLGDQVVGRDASSGFTEIADRPLVTQNGHDLNAEAILELAPTLIITDTSLGPWDTVLQMRDAGVDVVVVDSHRAIDSIGSLVGEVAAALGVPERGALLAERISVAVDETVAEIAGIAQADGEKLRMIFLYVRGQSGVYYMFGEESGADALITALGGADVSSEIGWSGMRPITDEGLVAANPDLVLVMTGGLESVEGVDGLLEAVPALQQTPAGEHRRVVDMADSQILSFGPDTARVLEALAVAVYAPDAAAAGAAG